MNASAFIRKCALFHSAILMYHCVHVPLQVTESPDPHPPPQDEGGEGIVGALMMVMQKRSKVIHSSGKYQYQSIINVG